jgi:peptidylprolyl isomerase
MSGSDRTNESGFSNRRKYTIIAIAMMVIIAVGIIISVPVFSPVVAQKGDSVSVYYILALDSGTVVYSNMNGTPWVFTLGTTDILPGFQETVEGMAVNQVRTVKIPSDKAYGPYRNDLVVTIDRAAFPADTDLTVGAYYTIGRVTDGAEMRVKILNVTRSTVTWDENHELAGKDITFTIRLGAINKKGTSSK